MASGDFIDKRNTFLELLPNFSIKSYSEDLKSYYSYLEQYLPDYLYKYCSVSEYSIHNLVNTVACFTNPNLFNDLFDSGANLSREGAKERAYDINNAILKLNAFKDSSDEISSIYKELKEQSFFNENDYRVKLKILRQVLCKTENKNIIQNNHILSNIKMKTNRIYSNTGDSGTNRLFGDITDNVRILCLSESENNTLMWAHYGQNDSGFCIKYSKKDILNFLKSRNDIFMLPIYYTKTNEINLSVPFEASPLELLKFYMFKKDDWKYENEWRLIQYCPNYDYNPFFYENFVAALSAPCNVSDYNNINFITPEAVYLGVRFDIHQFEQKELRKYKNSFLAYIAHNYSKVKQLSICNSILGYYINSL